ncbi:MAG: RdgB/HAM1 family non-canonical purine NTP pyrophosphatase [Actinomycetales bacterium]
MTEVVLATRNVGKLVELQRILTAARDEIGQDVELVGLDRWPDAPDVKETETSFAGNAVLKAVAAAELSGLPAVADDSGLCVDVMGGMPGILSARWSGRHGDDKANLDLLLAQLSELPDDARTGSFVCAAAVAMPDGRTEVVEGVLPGIVVREPRGSNGFGYDPIFQPDGERRTTAELSDEEKDAISHRGRAVRALVPVLSRLLSV